VKTKKIQQKTNHLVPVIIFTVTPLITPAYLLQEIAVKYDSRDSRGSKCFTLFIKVHILPSLADLLSSFRKNIEIKSVLARMLQKFISNVSFSWKRIIYLIILFIS